MPVKTENEDKIVTNSKELSDFPGRYDDLGEDLMRLFSNEHICTIYRKDEDKIYTIIEFIKSGLVKNERCLIFVDKKTEECIRKKIKKFKELNSQLSNSIVKFVSSDLIFSNEVSSNLERTVDLFKSHLEKFVEVGSNDLRVIIEMLPIESNNTKISLMLEFNTIIDKLTLERDFSIFCFYNEYRFEPKVLLEAIFTHPKLIFNGYLCDNSYFINSNDFQLIQKKEFDNTLYKRVVYDIVQREINEQQRKKLESYIQKESLKEYQ